MTTLDDRGGAPLVEVLPDAADAPPPPPARRRPTGVLDVVGPIVVLALFLGLWYLAHYVLMSEQRRFLVPPPHEVVRVAFLDWDALRPLLEGLWETTKVAAVGLAVATLLGVGLAVLMSQARWIERSVWPYLVALQAVPILAIVPLVGLLFGFGFNSRVFVCVLIAFFPIVANTLFGLLSADRNQHELFTLHGASRWVRLTKLQFPAALPAMFAGLRIAAGLSVIGAIVGDLLFQQGKRGIGQLINLYRARLQTEEMFAAIILASLLGIIVFQLFGFLSRRVVGHWYDTTRSTG